MSFFLSGGVEVLGFISPTEPTDEYPVIDPLYGIDGFRNVNTLTELNEIPSLRRRAGMIVGVSGGTEYYKLKLSPWNGTQSDWELFSLGSSFEGGVVTGETIFTQGVTANTFSASTYLGLPLDIYVTGGTYSNGSLTLINNNGQSFIVSGFYTGNTGGTDVTITGGSYSNGTLILVNNTGGTINISGFYTGGTDTTITGGTYSNGTITLFNNTGGTITISGLYTGETSYVNSISVSSGLSANTTTGNVNIVNTSPDLTVTISGGTGIVTGGTYPNFTITNSSPDQTVTISGGTGIITGGTYPNFTITNSAPDRTVVLSNGTGILTGGVYPNFTITNTSPDQTVTLTGGTNIEVTGSYPNFGINYTGQTDFPYLPLTGGTVTGDTTVDGTFVANTISGATLFGNGSNLTNINNFISTAITLNTSQILTLGAGIQLLPPPGSNNYYVIDKIILEYSFVTTPYVFPTSLAFYLDGCFDSYIDRTLLTSSFNTVCVISGNLRNTYQVGSGSGSVLVRTNRDVLNSNLIIGTQNNDNPISGDGTLRVKITYKIETFGT